MVTPQRLRLSRRTFVRSLASAPLAGLFPWGCGRRSSREPPDIVVLVADSLRARSLPIHGYTRQTAPFLSDLARRATVFTRCYSSATWTRPAVTGILSGLTPLEHRQWEFQKAFPPELQSFPRLLGDAGYQTGFLTANHAIGEGYGMEDHFHHVDFGAASESDFGDRLTRDAFRWIEGLTEAPILAYVHYFPPHGPYDPPEEFAARVAGLGDLPAELAAALDRRLSISLGNASMGRIPWYQALPHFSTDPRRYVDLYDASVLYADSLLQGFFETWDQLGRDRRTVFFITSDHGECLWEHDHWFDHGRMLADEILHVPLLVFDSDRPRRRVVEDSVSHLDLAATVLRVAGVEAAEPARGAALLEPGLRRRSQERAILSQEPVAGQESAWSVLRGRWRLVYNDCPRDGLAAVMSVKASAQPAGPERRVALSRPPTVGRGAVRLARGVTVESAFVEAPYPTWEEDLSVRLRVHTAPEASGPVAVRWRIGGAPAGGDQVLPSARSEEGDWIHRVPLPPVPSPRPEGAEVLTLQAMASRAVDAEWVDLLVFHRLGRRAMTDGVDLLGVVLSPPVPSPGEAVRLSYVWEVSALASPHLTVETTLRSPEGGTVLERRHRFYGGDPEERTPKPLIERWRLRSYSFEGRRFRFEESYWIPLPGNLTPARHTLEVSLVLADRGRETRVAAPRTAASVVPTAGLHERLRRTLEAGYGLEACHTLWQSGRLGAPGEASSSAPDLVEGLAGRYPAEGHLDFLRWVLGGGSGGEELARCLRKSPFHLGALQASGAAGTLDARGREVLEELTPPRRCSFRLGHLARLYGYRLERSPERPEQLYLSLWWEALSMGSTALAVECFGQAQDAAGGSARSSTWWYAGGTRSPSSDWRLGEAMVETVRLAAVDPTVERLRIALRVTERWELTYSDNRHSVVVPAFRDDGVEMLDGIELGTFALAELPTASADYLSASRRDPTFLRLHDVTAPVPDAENLVDEHPEVTAGLVGALETLILASERQELERGDEAEEEALPEETRKKLRALGYVA